MNRYESRIYFRYTGFRQACEVDLSDLGTSLIGFDKLIRKLINITGLKGDILVKATSVERGSIEVETIIQLITAPDQLPFDRVDYLLDFLKIASAEAWLQASHILNQLGTNYKALEQYLTQHPLLAGILGSAIFRLIEKASSHKRSADLPKSEFPKRISIKLYLLIHKRAFKDALKPIIDDEAKSIDISTDAGFNEYTSINQNNFQEFLGKDDEILPQLENGDTYRLSGEIRSLKSTVGDSLTFRLIYSGKTYNLDLIPPDNVSTKNYTSFYKELVTIDAEVIRTSLYKKPKLKLIRIDFQQQSIPGGLTVPVIDETFLQSPTLKLPPPKDPDPPGPRFTRKITL